MNKHTHLLNSYRNKEDGFTLVEILVTLTIVSILLAIAVPIYSNSIKQGKIAALKSDIMESSTKLNSYESSTLQDSNDPLGNITWPSVATFQSSYVTASNTDPSDNEVLSFRSYPNTTPGETDKFCVVGTMTLGGTMIGYYYLSTTRDFVEGTSCPSAIASSEAEDPNAKPYHTD